MDKGHKTQKGKGARQGRVKKGEMTDYSAIQCSREREDT